MFVRGEISVYGGCFACGVFLEVGALVQKAIVCEEDFMERCSDAGLGWYQG